MYRNKKISDFPIVFYGIIYSLYCLIAMAVIALTAILSGLFSWTVSLVMLIPVFFILYFFRNPKRKINPGDKDVVSPADGRILDITYINEDEFIKGKAVKVSIFLSVFNVHINPSPISGTVKYHSYREGKMLPAFKSHASDINERNTVGIESDDGYKVLVQQITGFIARRIVWWVRESDFLQKGEKFGLIKFGSCTEIIMPADTRILVKKNQKVSGGITIIGERQ